MKICHNCAYQTEEEKAVFCPACGERLTESAEQGASAGEAAHAEWPPIDQAGQAPGVEQTLAAEQTAKVEQPAAVEQPDKVEQPAAKEQTTAFAQSAAAAETAANPAGAGAVPLSAAAVPLSPGANSGTKSGTGSKSVFLRPWILIPAIVIVVLAVLAVTARAGYGYYLDNNPKILYLRAEAATMKAKRESIGDLYKDEADFFRALLKDSASIELQIRTKPELDNGRDPDITAFLNKLEKFSFDFRGGWDKQEDWSEFSLKWQEGRTDIADITVQRDKNDIYLASKTLMDSTLRWKKDEFLRTLLGIENPRESRKQLEKTNARIEAFKLSKQESAVLKKWMNAYFSSTLTNQMIKIEENVNYASPDGNVELTKMTLTINELMMKHMLVRLIDDVRTDESLRKMVVDRMEILFDQIASEAGEDADLGYLAEYSEFVAAFMDNRGKFDRDAFEEELQGMLAELRFHVLNSFSGDFTMEVYVNSKNIIVDRRIEIDLVIDDLDSVTTNVEWHESYWKDKQATVHDNGELNITIRGYDGSLALKTYYDQTYKTENETGVVEGKSGLSMRVDQETVLNVSLDYDIREAIGNKGTSEYDVTLAATSDGESLKLNIQAEREKELNGDTLEQDIRLKTGLSVPDTGSFSLDTRVDLTLTKGTPPSKSNVSRGALDWVGMPVAEKEEFKDNVFERFGERLEDVISELLD